MFDSGILASDLIAQIKGESDIAPDIPDENYIQWLNALEQLLYTEIIKEQGEIEECEFYTIEGYPYPWNVACLNLVNLRIPGDENLLRFEDIYAVFVDTTQLHKTTATSGTIFPNTYYKKNNYIWLNYDNEGRMIRIIYFVKPKLKTVENIGTTKVMLPIEFIDLAKAKLRGEAYKLANEDALAAKWLNDYNILLETFKSWVAEKQSKFGM